MAKILRVWDGSAWQEIASDLYNTPYALPTATTSVLGGVKIDDITIKISSGVISAFSVDYANITNKPSLFSGSYTDLTNKPSIPSLTGYATETYVDNAVSNLVASAPSTLNTLNELAAALNNDSSFATTIANQLSQKANTSSLATVATSGSYSDLTNKPTIPTNLDSLTDVTITGTPTNQQLLVYNSATNQWQNKDPLEATGIVYKAGYPNTKTATGILGQISIDGANGTMYVCTGTNNWQKISLNSANFTNTGGFN